MTKTIAPGSSRALRLRSRAACLALALTLGFGCSQVKRCAYEGGDRDAWQQPERVVEALAVEPGQTVADLGSGSGYFTLRLAKATGASGRVLAVDVDADMNELVTERAREAGVGNVETILAEHDDAKLPDGGVDLIFSCNTYHHLENRPAYFARLRHALAPDGRIAILEYREQGFLQRWHATPPDAIRSEMEAAGYRLVADHDFLERQSFLVFTPEQGGGG